MPTGNYEELKDWENEQAHLADEDAKALADLEAKDDKQEGLLTDEEIAGQQGYEAGKEVGETRERERIVDLLELYCSQALKHEDFMKALKEIR